MIQQFHDGLIQVDLLLNTYDDKISAAKSEQECIEIHANLGEVTIGLRQLALMFHTKEYVFEIFSRLSRVTELCNKNIRKLNEIMKTP